MFDPLYDTVKPDSLVRRTTTYHKGRWKFMAAKRQAYWTRGWLTKHETWIDAQGVKHIVRWEVRHDQPQYR